MLLIKKKMLNFILVLTIIMIIIIFIMIITIVIIVIIKIVFNWLNFQMTKAETTTSKCQFPEWSPNSSIY